MSRRALALIALMALLTACTDFVVEGIPVTSATSHTPSTSPTGEGLTLAEPGRPFDAGALLGAMRESRRPDGVPDVLETDAVASALAETIWTLDGEPWTAISAGGSCGPDTCTLELSGAHDGAQSDDLWVFSVAPETGAVELLSNDLRSLPTDLLGDLDALARSLLTPPILGGLSLTSVRWLPPPEDGTFVLSYRSGGEEGSCGADVTLDAVTPRVLDGSTSNC